MTDKREGPTGGDGRALGAENHYSAEPIALANDGKGAGRDVVGISRGAVSGQLMVSDQAARSIG